MRQPPQVVALWLAAALLVATCLVIAVYADAWLAPGPRFPYDGDPLVIEGERLTECLPASGKRAGAIMQGVRLYANVDLAFRAVVPRRGVRGGSQLRLFVVARGRPLDGAWPLLTLHVDGRYRGGFFVTSRDWRLYGVDVNLSSGEHHFRISYVNDRPGFPEKRDVDLKLVGLGDPAALAATVPAGTGQSAEAGAEPLTLSRTEEVATDVFDLDSGSQSLDGARVLWSNGYLGRTVLAPREGLWRVVARVRGDVCEGEGPRVLLAVDDDQLFSREVLGAGYRELDTRYRFSHGTHELLLVFDNDRRIAGVCDRNLHVEEIRFEPVAGPPEEDG
jgi:hypothetical protein